MTKTKRKNKVIWIYDDDKQTLESIRDYLTHMYGRQYSIADAVKFVMGEYLGREADEE